MNLIKKSLAFAAGAVCALTAQQASAALYIDIGNDAVYEATDLTNTFVSYTGAVGGFNINQISILGVNAFGGSGELQDNASVNVSTTGAGSLSFSLIQTDLSAAQNSVLYGAFSATITNATVTRSWYVDYSNTGALGTLIATTNGTNASFSFNSAINGNFSLTEVITINALGVGAKLSADDAIYVPEPASLALVGLALAGLGLATRRRKA